MFSWANFDDCSVLHQVVLNFSWAQPVQELGSDRRQRNQVSWLPHCHQVHKLQELQKEKGDLDERRKVVKEYSTGSWKTSVWPQLAQVT